MMLLRTTGQVLARGMKYLVFIKHIPIAGRDDSMQPITSSSLVRVIKVIPMISGMGLMSRVDLRRCVLRRTSNQIQQLGYQHRSSWCRGSCPILLNPTPQYLQVYTSPPDSYTLAAAVLLFTLYLRRSPLLFSYASTSINNVYMICYYCHASDRAHVRPEPELMLCHIASDFR